MTLYAEPILPMTPESEFDSRLSKGINDWAFVLKSILDGGISFADNADVSFVTVTSHLTPGTEFSVAHTLGKVPTGYIVTKQAGAGSIYNGTTANTASTIYFRSDVASTSFTLMVF